MKKRAHVGKMESDVGKKRVHVGKNELDVGEIATDVGITASID
jgi:hypothetical protein